MAVAAARDCLARAGLDASAIGMLVVSSSSAEQRFPGPAAPVAQALGCGAIPAFDLPLASAGGLFAMALANAMAPQYGNVLVVAAEKFSTLSLREPLDRNVAILFGDGAGACLISAHEGFAAITRQALHSDGSFAADLRAGWDGMLHMNGRAVILQAGRKLPAAISEVLAQAGLGPEAVETFLVHQANRNLLDRVAQALGVPSARFYSNIARYGNTSSASMPIAAAEYFASTPMSYAAYRARGLRSGLSLGCDTGGAVARMRVALVVLLFVTLAFMCAHTNLPWSDEAWFASPALNLIAHGNFGTSVLDPTASFRTNNLTGIRRAHLLDHAALSAGRGRVVSCAGLRADQCPLPLGALGRTGAVGVVPHAPHPHRRAHRARGDGASGGGFHLYLFGLRGAHGYDGGGARRRGHRRVPHLPGARPGARRALQPGAGRRRRLHSSHGGRDTAPGSSP